IFLLAIYSEFTFESKISRIKTTNILDKAQAKLMAESGLQMAMTRLKLYVEAHNKVQGNENAKGAVSPQLINQLWEVPFMYPIPVPPNSGAAFAATVADFEKESILEGEMRVTIQSISNRINLNQLRMRSEEHTSELQSRENLVCRLLLEKKNKVVSKGSTMYDTGGPSLFSYCVCAHGVLHSFPTRRSSDLYVPNPCSTEFRGGLCCYGGRL